jgi:drug/metabolite transporter (DMT)-like permease
MSSSPSRSTVLFVFGFLTLAWGSTWAVIRVSLEGFPPFLGVSLRFALAAVVLFVVGRTLGVRFGTTRTERWLWLSNALLSFSVSYGVVYWSEQHIPSGLAAIIFATFPLFVVLLSHFFLEGERMTRQSSVGVILGFGGLLCIYSDDLERLGGPQVAAASVIMLISPAVSAVSNVLVKRYGHDVHPISMAAMPMGLSALVMGAVSATFERSAPVDAGIGPVLALVYLAVAGSALTFTLYYWLLRHLPAVKVSLIAYTTPVIAVIIGVLVLDEPMTLRMWLGSAIVVGGVVVTTLKRR